MENSILVFIIAYFSGYKVSKYAITGDVSLTWTDSALGLAIVLLVYRIIKNRYFVN